MPVFLAETTSLVDELAREVEYVSIEVSGSHEVQPVSSLHQIIYDSVWIDIDHNRLGTSV